jgi:hypothetical protein
MTSMTMGQPPDRYPYETGPDPHSLYEHASPTADEAFASAADPPGPDPMTAIDVRNQVVGRMRWMNLKHAQHAWEQRYRDPLAPYGLAFLFVQPDPVRSGRLLVKAATKLWLAGPETEHLPRLLFGLNEVIGRRMQSGPFSVQAELANRTDDGMTDDAYYIGVGLSSLDTHTGAWEQVRDRVDNLINVPGQIMIVLTDQTTIVCDRRAFNEFNAFQIYSTRTLGDVFTNGVYRWAWSQPDQLRSDPALAEVLHWLDTLNLTLWQADNARIVATRSRGRGPGGGERGS